MCCRLCMVGLSDEERRQYQTGELVHIPSVIVDFNREGWADQLYAKIKGCLFLYLCPLNRGSYTSGHFI